MNEANVDAAYGWTKKRTRTSVGEIVPILECPNCSREHMNVLIKSPSERC